MRSRKRNVSAYHVKITKTSRTSSTPKKAAYLPGVNQQLQQPIYILPQCQVHHEPTNSGIYLLHPMPMSSCSQVQMQQNAHVLPSTSIFIESISILAPIRHW